MDHEKKLELEVLKMDHEKKLEVLKMDHEKKLEVLQIKMEMERKQRQSTAFHSKQLSAVVQRLVICLYVFFRVFFRHLPHDYYASSVFCFHTDKSSRAF